MSVSSPSNLSPAKEQRFKDLMDQGKEFVKNGKVQEGMEAMKEALTICSTSKLLSRIQKCEEYLQNCEEEEEGADEQMVEVCKGFSLFHEIYYKLYSYQREGIAWMWNLYKKQKGGILGDDMGLGKTIQIIGFLSGMFQADLVKHVLIIMPVSLLPNWKQEFNKWCPDLMLYVYHGGTKKERERNLYKVQRRGGVLLTSYGLVVSSEESFTSFNDRFFVWDYVILDEGHKIKNPTKTTKAVHNLASKNRLVLTGTPIQNNLEELWALYDFAHQGTLLGSRQTFKLQYENPITHARAKNSTIGERKLGTEIAHNLRKIIEPYFLRRTKDEVLKDSENKENVSCSEIDALADQVKNIKLSALARKNDLIIWTFLSDVQYKIYTGFLQSETVKNILMTKKSPLVQLTVLKKICDHPRLLSNKLGFKFLLNDDMREEDVEREFEEEEATTVSIENVSDEELISESGKMGVLIQLLENLKSEGHRTLVFSLSRKILDIVQKILVNRHWKVLRIDGTITKIEERARRVTLFQNDSSYPILLLTTQVGGVGLTLTAADRVVIYDPSWNPSTDAQAVDRVYRIGQSKNVVVYRFITCGTVEEKIYRRQIFKDSIIKQATGDSKDPYRYFTHQELYELFTVDNVRYSTTQVQLAEMHSQQRKTDTSLDEHIAYLHSLDIFGISDHDLMFSRNVKDETEDNDENVVCEDYIKKRVQQAQHLVQVEANLAQEDLRRAGAYSRPYSVTVPNSRKPSEKDNYKPPTFPENVSPCAIDVNNTLGPHGDAGKAITVLNIGDGESISAQSPITKVRSPVARRSNGDKYKLPVVIENVPSLTERNKSEPGKDKKAHEEFVIDVDVSPDIRALSASGSRIQSGSPNPRRALFQDEVVDIVSPSPCLPPDKRHSMKAEKHFSPVRSPRMSDFSRFMEQKCQSTVDKSRQISATLAQADDKKSKSSLFQTENRSYSSEQFNTSTNNSLDIIVPDSEEEYGTPAASNKYNSGNVSHRFYGSTSSVKYKLPHLPITPGCVSIMDSFPSENNSVKFHPEPVHKSSEAKPEAFLVPKPENCINPVHKSLIEESPTPKDKSVCEAKHLVFPELKFENLPRLSKDLDPVNNPLTEKCHVPKGTFQHITIPQHHAGYVSLNVSDEQKVFDDSCSVPNAENSDAKVSKLWRFEQMHEALSKTCEVPSKKEHITSDKKHISTDTEYPKSDCVELDVASPKQMKGTSYHPSFPKSDLPDSDKKCNFSSNRKNELNLGTSPVSKVSTSHTDVKYESGLGNIPTSNVSASRTNVEISTSVEYKQRFKEKCVSGNESINPGNQSDNLAVCDYISPRRITPLKVSAKSRTPVKLSSFAQIVANSPELSSEMSSIHCFKALGKESAPSETPEFLPSKVTLSDSDADDCADDSPVMLTKKKKQYRRVIDSDSEVEDSLGNKCGSDAETSEGSLKDFVVSDADADEQSSCLSDEKTDIEDESVEHDKNNTSSGSELSEEDSEIESE